MSSRSFPLAAALCALFWFISAPCLAQKDPRRDPLRLSSLGDSITEAVNAEEANPLDEGLTRNRWARWANGYTRDWDGLLDRTDVNSHHQRITAIYGKEGRKNTAPAKIGADSADLAKQALKAVKKRADYVTILMGQNDICGDDFEDIPIDAEFEANVRAGFDVLRAGLPPGATIYTLAIVDIYRLWQIGEDLEALGILECNEFWDLLASDLVPCGTMLDPDNTEEDRQFTRGRILAFNAILARVAAEYDAADMHHYWNYSDVTFTTLFEEDHVSEFDCFHPSAEGQKLISEVTWQAGPFAGP